MAGAGESRSCVVLRVLGRGGEELGTAEVSLEDWDEVSHPLVVCEEDRARLGVTAIEGAHHGADGGVYHRWRNSYAEDGSLLESVSVSG